MGFERCHPAVNFIYFAAVIAGTITFRHPIYLGISVLCAFAYSIKRNRRKAVVFNLCMLPLVFIFVVYYSSYHHFGVTVLQKNLIGNNITLESFVYGAVLGFSISGVIMWLSCVYSVVSSDKILYLFGKISPRISLFLSIALRLIPRLKKEAKKINMAQSGIGKGISQGTLFQRLKNILRIFSMLITWLIGALVIASDSMRSRGGSLRGRKAFSIYRFDNRDRLLVVGLFSCLTLTIMAVVLKQTDMIYNPRIIWKKIDVILCLGYIVLCLIPLGLELWTEYRFQKAQDEVLK